MIAAGLTASGHTTGLFTSPHVESFLERISVDGSHISEEAVVEFVQRVQGLDSPHTEPGEPVLDPAFFEYTLAMALHEYASYNATAAVLEAGVGGGTDATRAVEGVGLTVITNVDLDHTETLGVTLEQIVSDKAGAVRFRQPVVSGVVQAAPQAVVREAAERLDAPLYQLDDALLHSQHLFELPPLLAEPLSRYPTRAMNARLAAAALRLLGASESAVLAGLRTPPLPARGERYAVARSGKAGLTQPGGYGEAEGHGEVDVVLDGAHDPAAAERLVAEMRGPDGRGQPYVLLFGALGRKQGIAVLSVLARAAHAVVMTEASEGEGVLPGPEGAVTVNDPQRALDTALNLALGSEQIGTLASASDVGVSAACAASDGGPTATGRRPLVVVAGSLYLAGRIRPLLRAQGVRVAAAWESS